MAWCRVFKHTYDTTTYKGIYIGRVKFMLRPKGKGYCDKFGKNNVGGFVIPLGSWTLIVMRY